MSQTRTMILKCIEENPGVHLRELKRKLLLGIGTLDYHLHILESEGKITAKIQGKKKAYFLSTISPHEKELLAFLRNDSLRSIVASFSSTPALSLREIAQKTGLSQTTTRWHCNTLISKSILATENNAGVVKYSLKDRKTLAAVIQRHKKSFLDKILDNFSEMWE